MNTTWIAVLGALAVLGLFVLGYWRYQLMSQSSGRDDRYSPERLMTPEQAQMLDYLQDTFPGQVVLPNMMLRNMLAVRRATNQKRAVERLDQQRVDFVVCGDDGKPTFAFDIEQHPLSNAKHKAHLVKMKNRILKTAGVRFVFLKNSLHRMPSPSDFRKQLNLAELPKPKVKDKEEPRENSRQQLESQFSEFDSINTNTAFRDSEVMGLSGLMDLDQEGRRGGFSSAYSNSGFNQRRSSSGGHSKLPGESRFDSMDVRGGR
ncbi:DUF2726 domain-containing protein [Hydrogenophaga sp. PBL-H3]|uniref:DUF2726 domain-containing protein n=1 Tax=Hydrogenophaga sp. PBL-H3 TaxID=434010 RepID=UPI00131FD312|nr:DUF2726 domain-containing protein [Hydrogenophaga sp. PBL-H3]QHE77755.1 DUF2726 domain-containing protein [Hydrogenophaga sp. PBL-H3]QHE82179.1 DUF2726 domain-containing protein [Hydrogenophaga sp. PBL-H3]